MFPIQVADVPGVIKILDWFEASESFFIVMEKFVGQDLFDYISEQGPLKEAEARETFTKVRVLLHHLFVIYCFDWLSIHGYREGG